MIFFGANIHLNSFQGSSEPAAASISSIDDVDEEVDDSGVEESDVKLVMDQAQVCAVFFTSMEVTDNYSNLFDCLVTIANTCFLLNS